MVQEPPVAVAEPTADAPSYRVPVFPASAVPLNVGVVSLVMSSIEEAPVSELATRSGVEGVDGGAVTIVTESALEPALMLPATSVALAVIGWLPAARETVVLQLPPVAKAEPSVVVPS